MRPRLPRMSRANDLPAPNLFQLSAPSLPAQKQHLVLYPRRTNLQLYWGQAHKIFPQELVRAGQPRAGSRRNHHAGDSGCLA